MLLNQNLLARVLTAMVLLGIMLPVLFFSTPRVWAVFVLFFASAGAWEWARLNRHQSETSQSWRPFAYATLLICTGLCWLLLRERQWLPAVASVVVYLLAAAFWVVFAPIWMQQKHDLRAFRKLSLFVLFAAWLAISEARVQGVGFMLTLLALVWLADIGAYFVGRTLGRHKLAPHISPGKTWEGALGGLLLVVLVCGGMAWQQQPVGNFYALWLNRFGPFTLSAVLIVLVVFSILGDLFESLLKRQAGVKDSSNLLPGHGGVLDRIDALLPTLPLAMLLHQWVLH